MHEAYHADAIVSLGGCDKTLPASLMPLARTNAIGLTLYGGTVRAGPRACFAPFDGRELNAGSPYEAIGGLHAGLLDADQFDMVECCAIPGAGACGGMFTANTMASCIEALGMALPGTAANPSMDAADPTALDPSKLADVEATADAVLALLDAKTRTRDVMTAGAFQNAMAVRPLARSLARSLARD